MGFVILTHAIIFKTPSDFMSFFIYLAVQTLTILYTAPQNSFSHDSFLEKSSIFKMQSWC